MCAKKAALAGTGMQGLSYNAGTGLCRCVSRVYAASMLHHSVSRKNAVMCVRLKCAKHMPEDAFLQAHMMQLQLQETSCKLGFII